MSDKTQNCTYGYDYEHKCDCSEDDKCGCSFPNNMPHDFNCRCGDRESDCNCPQEDTEEYLIQKDNENDDGNETDDDCCCENLICNSLHCENLVVENISLPCQESEDESHCDSVLVRDLAPDFTSPAVMPDNTVINDFNLDNYLTGHYGLLIFYPADFTFVCPSELIAFNKRMEEFTKRNVKIVGISVDSPHAHLAWKKMPVNEGGVGDLDFPLISDINKDISYEYGVLSEDGVALRASFLIDKAGVVRHQIINDLPLGRSVDETLRIIDALQFYEQNGDVCPANWHKGEEAITPTPQGIADYLNKNLEKL